MFCMTGRGAVTAMAVLLLASVAAAQTKGPSASYVYTTSTGGVDPSLVSANSQEGAPYSSVLASSGSDTATAGITPFPTTTTATPSSPPPGSFSGSYTSVSQTAASGSARSQYSGSGSLEYTSLKNPLTTDASGVPRAATAARVAVGGPLASGALLAGVLAVLGAAVVL